MKLKKILSGMLLALSATLGMALTILLLPTAGMNVHAANGVMGGDGKTEATAYEISDLADLEAFREYVKAGNGKGEYFKLTQNIDLSSKYYEGGNSWTAIGDSNKPFTGIFDGGGYTISGLYINTTDSFQGLFGYIGAGTLKNLHVQGNVSINNGDANNIGGVVGELYGGSIDNCSFAGTIVFHGQMNVGGIVAQVHNGNISNCHNEANITADVQGVGGIVGFNYNGFIQNCYNTGTINGINGESDDVFAYYVGGIAGDNLSGTITNCYNTGSVTCSYDYVGGILGNNRTDGQISNCHNFGTVTCSGKSVGGIVGDNGTAKQPGGTIENCYYLEKTVNNKNGGIKGQDTDGAKFKTEAQFNSGEVMWLLQNGQATQVWGQWLSGNEHEIDQYPVLTNQLSKRVWKVTYIKNGAAISVQYVNDSHTVQSPTEDEWYDADGNLVDGSLGITKDMTLGLRVLFGGTSDNVITTLYNQAAEQNLDEWMEYQNGASAEGRFTYTISDNGGIAGATVEDNILKIPEGVNVREGGYTLKITAREKTPLVDTTIGLARSVASFGDEDVVLTVQVVINKTYQQPFTIKALPDGVTYGTSDFALETEGGDGDGAVSWQVVAGNQYVLINQEGVVRILGAGEVTIMATKDGGDNYYDASDIVTFTVHKANQLEFTIVDIPSGVTYGDTGVILKTTGGWENGKVTWNVESGSNLIMIDPDSGELTILGVGEVTISATKRGGDNYCDAYDTTTFVIHKAYQSKFKIVDLPNGVTYGDTDGGKEIVLTTQGGLDKATVIWEVTDGSSYIQMDAATGKLTILGACESVTIKATKDGGDNYYDAYDTITFTIHKAYQSEFKIVDLPNGVTYGDTDGGKEVILTTVGGLENAAVSWEVTDGDSYIQIESATGKLIILGACESVTIKATKEGGDNYYDAYDTITFTIHKAHQTALEITGLLEDVTINASFTLQATGGSSSKQVTWKITDGNEIATIGELDGAVQITGVGSVTVSATKEGDDNYYDVSASITFSVAQGNQAPLKIIIPNSITYGDEDVTLEATGGSGDGALTWAFDSDKVTIASQTDGTVKLIIRGVGEVTVTVTKAGDQNYIAASASTTFTINKANQPSLIINAPGGIAYGDKGVTLTTSGGWEGGTVTWETQSEKVQINDKGVLTILGAGEVTITATKSGGDNYYDATASITLIINKANQPSLIINVPGGIAYGDKGVTLTTSGGWAGGTVTWRKESGNVTINDKGELTILGVGEVTISATMAGGDNYYDTSATITFTINKANQGTFKIVDLPAGVTYGDNDFTLKTEGGWEGGTVTWRVDSGKAEIKDENIGKVTILGAGEVTITAIKSGGDNYYDTSVSITFTVNKANQSAFKIIDLPLNIIYGDNGFTLHTEGGTTAGKVTWAVVIGDTCVSIDPDSGFITILGAGDVTIVATQEGDENYYDASAAVSFIVEKATPNYTIPTGLKATYGDTLADVVLPEGWAWVSAPTTKVGNAGIHMFSATYSNGDTERYKTVTVTLQIQVAKAIPQFTVPDGLKAKVGDTLADVKLPEGWTWDDALSTKVGEKGQRTFSATFTPSDTSNYETVTVSVTINVVGQGSSNIWWIVLLILLLLLLLVCLLIILLVKRRKKSESEK